MKRKSFGAAAVAALAVLALLAPSATRGQAQDKAEAALKAAMDKETIDGNLKAAIEEYKRLAQSGNKSVAARALVRLGECYEKQGNAEARQAYQQVVSRFADQKDAVAQARARLAAIGGGGQSAQKAMRLIWAGSNVDGYESSISLDGRYVSFPDWDTGNLGYLDLATGTIRPLINTGNWNAGGSSFAEASAISRDGKQVAYGWYDEKTDRYDLRVVGTEGGSPRRVFEDKSIDYIEPRDWSPEGKWIAVNLMTYPTSQRTHTIGLVGAQDGALRILKSGTESLGISGFSPDGKYIVYTRSHQSSIVSTDGESEVPLLPGSGSSEYPVWSQDGSRIVFVSDRSGSRGLWSLRITAGKPVGEPELVSADFGSSTPMRFLHDGSLFFESDHVLRDIYVAGLDPATGKLVSAPRRLNGRVGNSGGRVAWLPDGKSLSFWNRGDNATLVEHTVSSGAEREIWGGKTGKIGQGYNGWFSDGAIMSREQSNKNLVFRKVDSRTGEVKTTWTLPALPSLVDGPVYSPDLMTMYFAQKDEKVPCASNTGVGARECLWIVSAREIETGRDRELFRLQAGSVRSLSVSRSGTEIAFAVSDKASTAIMVAPTAGGQPRELYREPERPYIPGTAWSQDGTHVLAIRAKGEMWSFPLNGGAPGKSTLGFQPLELAASPDGTQMACAGLNSTGEIWVMTGLFPATGTAR